MLKKIKKSALFRFNLFVKKRNLNSVKKKIALHKKKINNFNHQDFSIISSNCWGGSVYEDLKLPYQTPTVGLFFYAPCFLTFLSDLKTNINTSLKFINESKYSDANKFRKENYDYPIGYLEESDIEVHFLHYKSKKEAFDKWQRRKERINWENIFIACTDRDLMNEDLMAKFDALNYKNKVLFTAKKHKTINSSRQLIAYKKDEEVGDLYNERYNVTNDFKLIEWLRKK